MVLLMTFMFNGLLKLQQQLINNDTLLCFNEQNTECPLTCRQDASFFKVVRERMKKKERKEKKDRKKIKKDLLSLPIRPSLSTRLRRVYAFLRLKVAAKTKNKEHIYNLCSYLSIFFFFSWSWTGDNANYITLMEKLSSKQ